VFIGIKDVEASVTSPDLSGFKVIEPDTEYSQEVWLEVDNNSGETKTLSEVDEDFLEKVRKEYKSPEKVITGLKESNEIQVTNNREPTFNPSSSLIRLYYHIEVDDKNSRIKLSTTITELIGETPAIVIFGFALYSGNSRNGSFRQRTILEREWIAPRLGQTASRTFNVTNTQFWTANYTHTVGWVGAAPRTGTGSSETFLLNSKAKPYPKVINEHNNTVMPEPSTTTWKVVPENERTKREPKLKNKYIRWYIDTYGNPRWDWSGIHVHHVRPLKYGGTNAMRNLYPVPADFHIKVVTPWWANY
jgi:hypothetical protein